MAVELRKSQDIHKDLERDIKAHKESAAEKMRRGAILDLSQDLLRKLNPSLSSERVKELFFSSGDVLAKPLVEFSSEIEDKKSPISELNGWKAALNVAHFYYAPENRDLQVPERAFIGKSGKEREADEKSLVYISLKEHHWDINFERHMEKKVGFRKKTKIALQPPDVIVDCTGRIPYWNSISGADNLIIMGSINNGSSNKLSLKADGRCAIMSGTEVGNGQGVTLEVGEDIHQYGGIINPVSIKAQNYIQHDGYIRRPTGLVSGSYSEIKLTGKYQQLGGEAPNYRYVKISDVNHERGIETEVQIFAAEEGYDHAPVQKSEEIFKEEFGLTEKELQAQFEQTYKPKKEISRKEQDGTIMNVQTHVLSGSDAYINFIVDAVAAGWNIVDKAIIQRDSSYSAYLDKAIVTITKRIEQPNHQENRPPTLDDSVIEE